MGEFRQEQSINWNTEKLQSNKSVMNRLKVELWVDENKRFPAFSTSIQHSEKLRRSFKDRLAYRTFLKRTLVFPENLLVFLKPLGYVFFLSLARGSLENSRSR